MTPEQRLAVYERRYLSPRASVSHLLISSTDAVALCRYGPWLDEYWLGDGTQHEYERAASLPVCKRCLRVAGIAP